MNNREFAEKDWTFRDYCEKAGVKPTKRQASKFRMGKGLAYKKRQEKNK